jgi:hypothetical protein
VGTTAEDISGARYGARKDASILERDFGKNDLRDREY